MKLSKLLPLVPLAVLALCLGEARALVGVEVKLWQPAMDTKVSSTTDLLEGTDVSLESDLNMDSEDDIPFIKVWWGGAGQRVTLSRMKVKLSGDDFPKLQIDFGGETFVLGVEVESDMETTVYRMAWEKDWINTSTMRLGTIFGTEYLEVEVSLENSLVGKEKTKYDAPVPIAGLQGEVTLVGGLGIYAEVAGLYVGYGDFEGYFVEYEVGLKYGLAKGRFYACAGYRGLEIDVESGDDKAKVGFKGFTFGVGARF